MKRFLRIFFVLIISLISYLVYPTLAQAQTREWVDSCVGSTDPNNLTYSVATLQGLECLFFNILAIALQLIGIAMFIMFLFGGFKYLTSGGDPKAVEAAKAALTSAITGLVLAILAWFILSFISTFTGIGNLLFFRFGL